jgi:hypothetical protein
MKPNLLITCPKTKIEGSTAREIYSGSKMFRHLDELAAIQGFTLWIRSAVYGFILPETQIEIYDHRAQNRLLGEYPEGSGYWFGSDDYFSDAPDQYQRLLPKMTYGLAESAINRLKADFASRELYFSGNPPRSIRQITLDFFQDSGGTVEDLDAFLKTVFLPDRSYFKAIKSVLSDKHKHRGYDKIIDGNIIRLVKHETL